MNQNTRAQPPLDVPSSTFSINNMSKMKMDLRENKQGKEKLMVKIEIDDVTVV